MDGQERTAVPKTEWLKVPVVAAAVVGLVVGLVIGMTVGQGSRGNQGDQGGAAETQTNKVVKFVSKSVAGKVSAVSGQELTLNDQGDSLTVLVAGNARVEKVTITESQTGATTPPPPPQRAVINLSEVKAGDRVTALLSSQSDGSFQATSVTVSETR